MASCNGRCCLCVQLGLHGGLLFGSMRRGFREQMAELLGTFVMVLLGNGCVAQQVLSGGNKDVPMLSIHLGWGAAVTVGVYIAGGVSAHLNPAISLAMACYRDFDWRRLPSFWLAQVLGAFLSACVLDLVYGEALRDFDELHNVSHATLGPGATAGIFATYPAAFPSAAGAPARFASTRTCAANEFLGTAILVAGVLAITEPLSSASAPAGSVAFMVGQVVFAIGLAFGWTSGYAINPARDIGPRLYTFVAGWGDAVFEAHDHYFLVPLLAPFLGALLGGGVYAFAICHETAKPPEDEGDPYKRRLLLASPSTRIVVRGSTSYVQ